MALDISNKINDATDNVILQGKDISNRIVSAKNDIKHHINDAEMCILEAIEGLGESISNIGGIGGDGNCNCDFSNYYDKGEINTMFAELKEDDALSKVGITFRTNMTEIFETGETKRLIITLKINNQGLNPEKFTVEIRKNNSKLTPNRSASDPTQYTCSDTISASQKYYATVTYTSSNPNKSPKSWTKTCDVYSYFLTYYGFGTSPEDVFANGDSELVSSSLRNDQEPYDKTYKGEGVVNFYLLVPLGVEKASIGAFKMEGAPTVMYDEEETKHTNIHNIEAKYRIQKTKATYENGARIKIYNSNS